MVLKPSHGVWQVIMASLSKLILVQINAFIIVLLQQEGIKFIQCRTGPDSQAPVGRKGHLSGFQQVYYYGASLMVALCDGLQAM